MIGEIEPCNQCDHPEEWKPVPNFPNYLISTHGRVKQKKKRRIISHWHTEKGYVRVTLFQDGRRSNQRVHILSAITFHDNPRNLPEVDHEDQIRDHNCSPNVRWADRTMQIANRRKK